MSESLLQNPRNLRVIAIFSIVFGLMSIMAGGSVLFVDGAVREALGSYVAFVVWFNFVSGFFYLAAGVGLFTRKKWVFGLAALFSIQTLIVLLLFAMTVVTGIDYEPRTFVAMVLRLIIWITIATVAYKTIYRYRTSKG